MNRKDGKTLIMSTAEELFFKYGFRRVSVDEICRSAKVSRKTFYVYFANKETLVIAILDKINETYLNKFLEIMGSDASFVDKMMLAIGAKIAFTRQMSADFVADFTSLEAVVQHYHKMADKSIEIGRSIFLRAQEKGEIRRNLSIDFIMTMLNYQVDLYERQEFRSLFKDSESLVKQMSEMFLFGIVEG
jgi:AcrR family transcriptional regulator